MVEEESAAKSPQHKERFQQIGPLPEMEILLASTNPHKLQEFREILVPLGIAVVDLASLNDTFEEPVETETTFAGNAKLKAVGYAAATGRVCMADDSGLSVDALDGKPGVLSARFAGSTGSREERDAANNALLLELMIGVPDEDRFARFECAVCVADPNGAIIAESSGTFEGIIGRYPEGENGFGYDPLLYLPDVQMTSAQLSSQEKNFRSHRGEAVRNIAAHLEQLQRSS